MVRLDSRAHALGPQLAPPKTTANTGLPEQVALAPPQATTKRSEAVLGSRLPVLALHTGG